MSNSSPEIPVSWGELIDKITILEIKREKITEVAAQENVRTELALLAAIAGPVSGGEIADIKAQLRNINEELWKIEDAIRAKEAAKSFDDEFIALARSVYKTNDRRAALKKQINVKLGSTLTEEKSYRSY